MLSFGWQTKVFWAAQETSVGWGRITAKSYATLQVDFSVDGQIIHTQVVQSRKPFPMPAVKGRLFQFRIYGKDTVTEAAFASSPREFRALR